MARVKKVRKHQDGDAIQNPTQEVNTSQAAQPTAPSNTGFSNRLRVLIDGQETDLDLPAFRRDMVAYIDSSPQTRKNRSELINLFEQRLSNAVEAANRGEYYEITTAGRDASRLTAEFLTPTERGHSADGRLVRNPRADKDAYSHSLFNQTLGTIGASYYQQTKERAAEEAEAKRLADERAAQEQTAKTEAETSAREGSERQIRARDVSEMYDLATGLYGRQHGLTGADLASSTLTRFWEGREEDEGGRRSDFINYLSNFRDVLNREDIVGDSELSDAFRGQGKDLSAARDFLNSVNFDDSELDLLQVMDKLGLGTTYRDFTDRRTWDGYLRGVGQGAETTEPSQEYRAIGNQIYRGTDMLSGWDETNPAHTGIRVHYTRGIPTSGEVDGVMLQEGRPMSGRLTNPDLEAGYGAHNHMVYVDGLPIATVGDFLNNPENRTKYPDIFQTVAEEAALDLSVVGEEGWSTLDRLNTSPQRNPYTAFGLDLNSIPDRARIKGYNDESHNYTEARPGGTNYPNFAVIRERLDDGSHRVRFSDGKVNYTGQIQRNPATGEYIFVSFEKDATTHKPKFTKNLGHRDEYGSNRARLFNIGLTNAEARAQTAREQSVDLTRRPNFEQGGSLILNADNIEKISKLQRGGSLDNTKALNLFGSDGPNIWDEEYKMSAGEKAELAGLGAELAGLAASFVPGVGNVIAGATGAVGTLARAASAKSRGEEVSGWGVIGNLGLDAATAIPVLGTAAKLVKARNLVGKSLPLLMNIASSVSGGTTLMAGLEAFNSGDYSAETFRKIAAGLTGSNIGGRGIASAASKRMTMRNADVSKVRVTLKPEGKPAKGGKGVIEKVTGARRPKSVEVELTADQRKNLSGLTGDARTKAIRKIAVDNKVVSSADDIQNVSVDFGQRLAAPEELNWWGRQMAQNRAFERPDLPGVDRWTNVNTGRNWWARLGVANRTPSPTKKPMLVSPPARLGMANRTPSPTKKPMLALPPARSLDLPNGSGVLVRKKGGILKARTGLKLNLNNINGLNTSGGIDLNRRIKPTIVSTNNILSHYLGGGQPYTAVESTIPTTNKFIPTTLLPEVSRNPNNPSFTNPVTRDTFISEYATGIPKSVGTSTGKVEYPEVTPKVTKLSYDPITVSEGLRALFNIDQASKIDTRVERPLMSHTQEIMPRVSRNPLLDDAYNRAGLNIKQQAGQPISTDAAVQTAAGLAGAAQANQIMLEGATQQASNIAQQEARADEVARGYASNRAAVANQNVQTLAQAEQSERQLENAKRNAITSSIDNFWADTNARRLQRQGETREIDAAILELERSHDAEVGEMGVALGIDPKKPRNLAITELQSESDSIRMKRVKTPQEEARLREIDRALNALTQQQALESLRGRRDIMTNRGSSINLWSTLPKQEGAEVASKLAANLASGGTIKVKEKLLVEDFKNKEKGKAAFIKDYNKWLTDKAKVDTKEQSVSVKQAHDLIKGIYKK